MFVAHNDKQMWSILQLVCTLTGKTDKENVTDTEQNVISNFVEEQLK